MRIQETRKNGKNNGITLIALVITIIVLLILAGVTIATLTGDNGILTQAKNAQTKMEEASKNEEKLLQSYEDTIGDVLEGEIWRLNLNTIEYSTYVTIHVVSKYFQETTKLPDTLKGYKELYILKGLGVSSAYETIDEYVIDYFQMDSMEELLQYIKDQTNEEITRDQFVYGMLIPDVTNENEALEMIGYSKENIEQIEAEYEEMKNQTLTVEVPERYKNRTYTITYPDGTTQNVAGEDLLTFEGKFKVTENNRQYIINVKDSEANEENLNVTVNNFVKYVSYEQGDYTYTLEGSGYRVGVKDKTLTEYGEILSNIEGIPVVSMYSTFEECSNMIKSPKIPNGITNLRFAYWKCISLVEAPEIPSGVTDMYYTFTGCENLQKAPQIPNTVINMGFTFSGCKKIVEAPEIPVGVTNMGYTFKQCIELKKAPKIPDTVTNMKSTFERCTNLEEAPEIPDSVTMMWGTFDGCSKLKEGPEIPSGVTNMQEIFENCSMLSGKVIIHSVELIGGELGKSAFKNAGTQGTGLIVIVPNDNVRALLIQNSNYRPDKVKIVKSEDEI